MKRSMLVVVVWVFFLVAVQSSAEVRITPDGIPSSNDAASVHLSGSFIESPAYEHGPNDAVVSGVNTYAGTVYSLGGYFSAAGAYSKGVYGIATGSSGRGVYGIASGSNGRGVYGYASDSETTTNYGGYFQATGTEGIGVYGIASNTGNYETNFGGYFSAAGYNGKGVYGEASGNNGRGVYGTAGGETGMGVYGTAAGSSGRGVYGESMGTHGTGVWGLAKGGEGVGVQGFAMGTEGIGVAGAGMQYDFYARGWGTTNFGPFTGAHEVKFGAEMPGEIVPGLIVSATGPAEVRKNEDGRISLSSTLPTVTLSARERDKAVFGVIVSQGSLPKDHWYESKPGERFGVVNALGEGRVWVTNRSGTIEAGDYITTSTIPGYGQRQADDLLHSYTLGKAIETVDGDRATEAVEYEGKTYKAYLIAVVYTSG